MQKLQAVSLPKKLLMVSLIGVAIGTWGVELTHTGPTEAIALVFVAFPVLLAGLLVTGEKWVLITSLLLSGFYLLGAFTTAGELDNLFNPPTAWAFLAITVELLSCLAAVLLSGFELVKGGGRRSVSVKRGE